MKEDYHCRTFDHEVMDVVMKFRFVEDSDGLQAAKDMAIRHVIAAASYLELKIGPERVRIILTETANTVGPC